MADFTMNFGNFNFISEAEYQKRKAAGTLTAGDVYCVTGEGGGGAVQSVNGQTGAVVLGADDVGAVVKNQGAGNAGKFMVVGADGNVAPVAMNEWSGGSF